MKWILNNVWLALLAALIPAAPVFAQQDNDLTTKREINKIKKSSAYIYAEITDTTAESARAYAEESLYEKINQWVSTQKSMLNRNAIVVNNLKHLWTTLAMPRGNNMYRAFVYVKKDDIIAPDNTVTISNEHTAKVETIDAEQPSAKPVDVPGPVKTLAAIKEYATFTSTIARLQKEGKIGRCERYMQLDEPEKYYLAIYDRSGKIIAILTPGPERKNIANGRTDSEKNYSGCGALGFNIK